jgi:hypothetical protein
MKALAKLLGAVVAGFLALALLLVAGGGVLLHTPWGGRWLARTAQHLANDSLQGKVAVGSLRLRGLALLAEDVTLLTPDGEVVARVEALDVRPKLARLLHHEIDLEQVSLRGVKLGLRQDERGLNLVRAVTPKTSSEPAQNGPSRPWTLRLGHVELERASVAYGAAGSSFKVQAKDLELRGAGAWRTSEVEGTFQLQGMLTEPRQERLALDLRVKGPLERLNVEAKLGTDALRAEVRLEEALPRWNISLEGDLRSTHVLAEGSVDTQTGAIALGRFQALAPGAELRLTGAMDEKGVRLEGALAAKDLVRLTESLKDLGVPRVSGGGHLELAVSGPPQRLTLRTKGELHDLRVQDNSVKRLTLDAQLPDLSHPFVGQGSLRGQGVRLGEVALAQVDAKLTTRGRALTATLSTQGAHRVQLALQGLLDTHAEGLAVSQLELRLPRAHWHLLGPMHLRYAGRQIEVHNLALASEHQRLSLEALLHEGQLRARLEGQRLDLSRLPIELLGLPAAASALTGEVSLRAEISGKSSAPKVEASLSLSHVGTTTFSGLEGVLDAHLARERLHLKANLHATKSQLVATLDLPLDALASGGHAPLTGALTFTSPDVSVLLCTLAQLGLSPLTCGGGRPWLRGAARLTGTVSGYADAPVASLELEGRGLQTPQLPRPLEVDTTALFERDGIGLSFRARGGNGKTWLDGSARLKATWQQLRSGALTSAPIDAQGAIGPMALDELALAQGHGRSTRMPTGTVSGTFTAKGTIGAPELHFHGRGEGLALGEMTLGAGALEYDYRRARHALSLELSSAKNGGVLRAQGELTLDLGKLGQTDTGDAQLKLALKAQSFNPSALAPLIPQVDKLTGQLDGWANVEGPLRALTYRGELVLHKGLLALQGYGQYEDVNLDVRADAQGIRLVELSAREGQGHVKLTGQASRTPQGYQTNVRAELTKFPVFTEDQRLATLTGHFSLQGKLEGDQGSLGLDLPELHLEMPASRRDVQSLQRPTDILVLRGQEASRPATKREGPKPAARPLELVVTVNAPRNLWIKSDDVNGEVGLSEGFKVHLAPELALEGEVRVLRGQVDVLGRKFEVQKDSLARFNGDPQNPTVAATAIYNDQKDAIKVFLGIEGQAQEIKLKPRSEPPLSDSEIYTLLATGSTTLQHGAGSASPMGASQTVSILGSLVAGALKKTLSSALPLDVLTVEAGAAAPGSGQPFAGSVQAGRYFGSRLYVGYEARIGADPTRYENRNSVHLEYQFSPRWRAEGQYGDANQGNLDFLWSRDF